MSDSNILLSSSSSRLTPSPPPTLTSGPIRRKKAFDLDRDTRHRILVLHNDAEWDRSKIAERLGITYAQVRHAIEAGHPTPQKRSGRATILTEEQIDELEDFICQSRDSRQMPYKALATGPFAHFKVSWSTIRGVLKQR